MLMRFRIASTPLYGCTLMQEGFGFIPWDKKHFLSIFPCLLFFSLCYLCIRLPARLLPFHPFQSRDHKGRERNELYYFVCVNQRDVSRED